jgi:hypothetical protein
MCLDNPVPSQVRFTGIEIWLFDIFFLIRWF